MKQISVYIFVLTGLLFGSSCVDEDFFGLSSFGRIKGIEVSNQASAAVISDENSTVTISFPEGVSLTSISVRSLTLSSFATATIQEGDVVDLSADLTVNVTAEDGTVTSWTIVPEIAGSEPQLPNADFEEWYLSGGGYFEPGIDAASTIWGTGNPGTQLIGVLSTTPEEETDGNTYTRMETKFNGALPAAFGTPISAGTIFVGKFNADNIDPSNPRAAIDFGTPFSGRPKGFTLRYRYTPGPDNEDKNQDPLPFPDNCDIYVLLEVRNGGENRRLGTAWFRSGEEVSDFQTIDIPMTYGPLDGAFPDFMKPADGNYISADSAAFVLPTHLTFVASSSFDGDNFAGAVGSLLEIDDLVLKYD